MKEQKYMPRPELDDYIKLDTFADEALEIAKRTPVERWTRKLKTISTYLKNIIKEREASLDAVELEKVKTRRERTALLVYTRDEVKMLETRLGGKGKNFQMDADNWVVMCGVIDNYVCRRCVQGDKVKNCEVRKLLHKSFAPTYIGDPKEGECEYHWESKAKDFDIEVKEE